MQLSLAGVAKQSPSALARVHHEQQRAAGGERGERAGVQPGRTEGAGAETPAPPANASLFKSIHIDCIEIDN